MEEQARAGHISYFSLRTRVKELLGGPDISLFSLGAWPGCQPPLSGAATVVRTSHLSPLPNHNDAEGGQVPACPRLPHPALGGWVLSCFVFTLGRISGKNVKAKNTSPSRSP
jgi:hypothetical protein